MLDKTTNIYIWTVIERILFSPISDKEIKSWFRQYYKFSLKLWEKEVDWNKSNNYKLVLNDNFQIFFKTPFDLPKFSVDISYKKAIQSIHYDNSKYFSKIDLVDIFNSGIDKEYLRKLKQVKPSREEIRNVLTSMIVHPDLHVHFYKEKFIEEKDIKPSNYIRLGFNTNNPFMFLYHLAFQFCDYKTNFKESEMKQAEFKRLVDLVENNIEAKTVIPSGVLFGLGK